MAGSLIKIDEEIVTSAVATVELGGANWDSSYDVYMVKMNNVQCATDNKDMRIQLKNGATVLTPYSRASKDLRPDTTFSNNSSSGATRFDINSATGNGTAETGQAIFYLFNFNNASEYSFITYETNYLTYTGGMIGQQGGGVVLQASACDTIVFYWESAGNFSSGTFTLYGLKK
jgi:hypothetical protein